MTRICLLALCGLPAAGKTTFSNCLAQLTNHDYNILHICFDNYLNFNTIEAVADFKTQRSEILELLECIIRSLRKNNTLPDTIDFNKIVFKRKPYSNYYLIICDDNNYYSSMRYKFLQLCRQHELAFAQIYFDVTLEQSLRWNAQRVGAQRIPTDVLQQMAARLETPANEANTWEGNGRTLIVTPTDIDFVALLKFLAERFQHIEQPVPMACKQAMPMTKVHELDILLRRRIKLILEQAVGNNKPAQAAQLNALRRQILLDFRNEKLCDTDAAIDFDDYLSLLK